MDKVLLKFFADVLYAKAIINMDEIEAIYDVATPHDLDMVYEKMMRGEYNSNRRGDSYYRFDGVDTNRSSLDAIAP